MAAAALIRKAACGRETQLKIWMGRALNGASMPSGRKVT
jgi:hypothetical protein